MSSTIETDNGAPQDLLLPLHGNHVSYVPAVVGGRYLAQRYWGRRSDALDALATVRSGTAPYLATQTLDDGRVVSPARLPLEYPTLGAGRLGPVACGVRFGDGARTTGLAYRGHDYDAVARLPAPWYRDRATGVRYDAGLLHSRGLELDPPCHDRAAQHWILERQER